MPIENVINPQFSREMPDNYFSNVNKNSGTALISNTERMSRFIHF